MEQCIREEEGHSSFSSVSPEKCPLTLSQISPRKVLSPSWSIHWGRGARAPLHLCDALYSLRAAVWFPLLLVLLGLKASCSPRLSFRMVWNALPFKEPWLQNYWDGQCPSLNVSPATEAPVRALSGSAACPGGDGAVLPWPGSSRRGMVILSWDWRSRWLCWILSSPHELLCVLSHILNLDKSSLLT